MLVPIDWFVLFSTNLSYSNDILEVSCREKIITYFLYTSLYTHKRVYYSIHLTYWQKHNIKMTSWFLNFMSFSWVLYFFIFSFFRSTVVKTLFQRSHRIGRDISWVDFTNKFRCETTWNFSSCK